MLYSTGIFKTTLFFPFIKSTGGFGSGEASLKIFNASLFNLVNLQGFCIFADKTFPFLE